MSDARMEYNSPVGGYSYRNVFGDHVTGSEGNTYNYPTKDACYKALVGKMALYPPTSDKEFNPGFNYSTIYNSWLNATGYMFESITQKNYARNNIREAYFETHRTLRWSTGEGIVEIKVYAYSESKREANNWCCWKVFKKVMAVSKECDQPQLLPSVQMNKETEQGLPEQESEKASNTIITRDQGQASSISVGALDSVSELSNTEPSHRFETLTGRWMPIDKVVIKVDGVRGDTIAMYSFPESFYSLACAPNLTPFESFIYGQMDIEVRVMVNANKFNCGKLIVSSKYDSYQADTTCAGYQSALARNHVILDLTANNEGVLRIPFRYHRPWVRLIKHNSTSAGIRPAKYCSVYLQILSPLTTGPGGPSQIDCRVFYRLLNTKFAGMSYRVSVQMDDIQNIVTGLATTALRGCVSTAEKCFDQVGKSSNQDKPGQFNSTIIIPKPRWNFGTGKGVTDVQPLRVNPHTLTNYANINVPDDEPQTFYDLARIWGVVKAFDWSKDDASGTVLLNMIVDPTSRDYVDIATAFTPLEYTCANFAFWQGTIEIRLDFVSNAFHTGAVQLSAEFGRTSDNSKMCEASSTYIKAFQLGEQKSVTFTVPYIYDTVMRRSNASFWRYDKNSTEEVHNQSLSVAPLSLTRFKVIVLNELRPVAAATSTIEVLVFMRAGKNFSCHGLKANSIQLVPEQTFMDNFPRDGYMKTSFKHHLTKRATVGQSTINVVEDGKESKLPVYWDKSKFISGLSTYNEVQTIPRTQMETGNKENQDTTEDFNSGKCVLATQTLDCHLNFKDLLRRPTLLLLREKVTPVSSTGKTNGYFIPLMPPTSSMCCDRDMTNNSIWAKTLWHTSAVSILSCFRCWRGGMRYTIIVHGAKEPVYVSLIPHSGVRLLGNQPINAQDDMPMYGSNFTTEIIVPSVNPTATIEVPYDTENTWTLMNEENNNRNYTWRDKGDYNSGHLVVVSHEKVSITVFWSAADDFTFANFYGIPYGYDDSEQTRLPDNSKPQVQMDFHTEETTTSVASFLKKTVTAAARPKNILRMAASCIPGVGSGLVLASAANDVDQHMTKLSSDITSTTHKLGQVADAASSSILEVTEVLKQAVETTVTKFGDLVNASTLFFDVLLDMLVAWYEKSWVVVGMGIVRFIVKILPQRFQVFSSVMEYGALIADSIRDWFTDPLPTVQGPVTQTSTLVGVLVGLVGSIMGVYIDRHRMRSIPVELLTRLTSASGMSYLMNVLRYIQSVFGFVKDLIMEALGYVSPEAQALKLLSESNEKIAKFIREAQIMTSEVNGSILVNPVYRARFWKTVLEAYYYQKLICQVPSNVVSSQLAKLCSETIKLGNEKFLDISASPVRFEPMVICLEGGSGMGKSHLTEALVSELLKATKHTSPVAANTYYRTPGTRFWSGYTNQPVIVYDEWLNTMDPIRNFEQIDELMRIKSTALFIPEMAHLEKKESKANPLIIIILTNNAFPNISEYARCPEATFRRREVVIRVERKEGYENIALKESADQIRNYEHLKFKLYKRSTDSNSVSNHARDFADMKEFLVSKWKKYYQTETVQVRRRMELLPSLAMQTDIENNHIDPFALFYQMNARLQLEPEVSSNGWTPYEQLEYAITQTNALLTQVEDDPVEDDEEIVWESMQRPAVQSWLSWGVGFALTSPFISAIAQASSSVLEKIEQRLLRTEVIKQCRVCYENKTCSYVCRDSLLSEDPHYICALCYMSWRAQGHTECATCRSAHMVPAITYQEYQMLSVWARLVARGARGMKWIATKIINYFAWRDQNWAISYVIDMIMSVVYLQYQFVQLREGTATCIDLDFAFGLRWGGWLSLGSRYIDVVTDFVRTRFQIEDDWENQEEEPQPIERVGLDNVQPRLNEEYLAEIQEGYFEPGEIIPICKHKLLIGQVARVTLIGEVWRLPDLPTNRLLEIPVGNCGSSQEDCIVSQQEYRSFITHYLRLHEVQIRHLIISYMNRPSVETMEAIPKLFRPIWIQPVENHRFTWWEVLGGYWRDYAVTIKYLLGVISVVGTLYGTYKYIYRACTMVQTGGLVGSPEQSARLSTRRQFARRSEPIRFGPQTQSTNVSALPIEAAKDKIERNTYKIEVWRGDKLLVLYGVGIFGHTLLLPKHYVKEITTALQSGGIIYGSKLIEPQTRIKLNLAISDFIVSEDTDLAYCKLPPSVPLFKDIRKFMAKDEDLERVVSAEASLLVVPGRNQTRMREVEVELKTSIAEKVILDQNNDLFVIKDVLEYNYSQPGACGSLLLLPNTQRPIVGMHCAGVGDGKYGLGYSVILTREAIGTVVQGDLEPSEVEEVDYLGLEESPFLFAEDICVSYEGCVTKEDVPYIPAKSKLTKSLLYGKPGLETHMEPAILHKNDPRYVHQDTPLFAGCMKHGQITLDFAQEELEIVRDMLWDGWYCKMKPLVMNPKVLTIEEAIVGFPHLGKHEYYRGMDLSTSAGYPYILSERKTKADYIKPIYGPELQMEGVEWIDAQVIMEMNRKNELRKKGIVPQTIFVDTLKDEKRPHEKVMKHGGTRVFCNSSLDYVIQCRQYFMHFIAAFMKKRHDLMHAVGINPMSSEWTFMTKNLLTKNHRFIGIDYQNFGPGYNSGVAKMAYSILIRWIEENLELSAEELEIAKILIWECIQSKHIMHSLVYTQVAGSPSGAVFTTIINTIVNQLYILLAWRAIMAKYCVMKCIPLVKAFKRLVCLYAYGDDLNMTVDKSIAHLFNAVTITEYLKSYNIVATDANKTGDIKPDVDISEATFLKRGFKRHPTRSQEFLSPLKWDSIISATQWVWRSHNMKEATRVNVDAAMIQCHGWGKDKFNDLKNLLNKYLVSLRMDTVDYTWEEIDEKFYTTGLDDTLDQFINFSY